METTAGLAYAVNVTEAPVTVKAKKTDDSTETIKVLESVGQHTFIAMSGETVFDGGAVGLVQGPFDPARALSGDNGGAGTPLSPAELAAVTSLASGSINYDGAFAVHAQQLWLYGASIDTMGGNVYHRTGSATFTGANTTAVMSGTGFIVYNGSASASSPVIFKVSADASVDPFISLADANGNEKVRISGDANDPKIEINGDRALTASYADVMYWSSVVTTAIKSTKELVALAPRLQLRSGNYIRADYGALNTYTDYVYADISNKAYVNVPQSNTMQLGLTEEAVRIDYTFGGNTGFVGLYAPNADVRLFVKGSANASWLLTYFSDAPSGFSKFGCKTCDVYNERSGISNLMQFGSDNRVSIHGVYHIFSPNSTGFMYSDTHGWHKNSFDVAGGIVRFGDDFRVYLYAPKCVNSFRFFQPRSVTKDELVYLFKNIGSPTAPPQLFFGISSSMCRNIGSAEEPEYQYRDSADGEWGAGELHDAITALAGKWELKPTIH